MCDSASVLEFRGRGWGDEHRVQRHCLRVQVRYLRPLAFGLTVGGEDVEVRVASCYPITNLAVLLVNLP